MKLDCTKKQKFDIIKFDWNKNSEKNLFEYLKNKL